jgi:hypothetical protein
MRFQVVHGQENDPDFFIHVAEKSVSPAGQQQERHTPASHRRRLLHPTRPRTTDESLVRNGR